MSETSAAKLRATGSSAAPSAAAAPATKRKTFKRALKGTVGVGLAAASAALIARSDDIGEWLQSVAPHVLPHTVVVPGGADTAVLADFVLRAIAEAKSCVQEGVNVCLDAEGRVTALYTFISQWYLSPRQHVVEMALSILVLSPLVYLYFKLCRARLRLKRAAGAFDAKRPSLLMKLWGAALLGLVGAGAFLKFTKQELISHPAYLWQPCHVHSLVMGLCAFVETEGSLLVMHVATTLWWGPFLAFVAPSLPTDPVEIAIFWAQHALMLLAPFLRLTVGTRWLYRDFWWNSVGFVFLTCYHWWWLAPVNLFTGVNVATMSVPPDSLEMFGKYYRPVWGLICGLLQLAAVGVMCVLARVFGQMPSSTAAAAASPTPSSGRAKGRSSAMKGTPQRTNGNARSSTGSSSSSSNNACGVRRRVPDDAVGISQEKAVSLVDGN
ncbi:conserved unknown protein [Ectocarpus siliculosus]|uniref:Transmembrane protein n=1 Tax=Ectocarpus siliculosus TaxID=2880 RepID=D8LQ85_ECTSI|nr:conserved unknown protein [Ectocarpus siliculosus]|eukprot:CBN77465.1 conserved unknown protein [Ectocarpus siliculosus]